MLCHFYVRKGIVYIPTMAETEAGFYLVVEPVEVVQASDNEALQGALKQAISRGNPRIPTPRNPNTVKSVIPEYAGVKSWSAFDRGAEYWKVRENSGIYEVLQMRRRTDRGWEPDPTTLESLPSGTSTDDLIRRVVERVAKESKAAKAQG